MEIPFLAMDELEFNPLSTEYDFWSFGSSIGFFNEHEGLGRLWPQQATACLIQSWLYFGTLSALLKHQVGHAQIMGAAGRIVDSEPIMEAIGDFASQEQAHKDKLHNFETRPVLIVSSSARRSSYQQVDDLKEIREAKAQVVSIMNQAATTVHYLDRAYNVHAGDTLSVIILSVKTLLSTLGHIYANIWESESPVNARRLAFVPYAEASQDFVLPAARGLMRWYESLGWCPAQTAQFMTLPYSAAYFFARLPRTRRDHSNCTNKCLGWNSHEGHQVSQHRSQDCQCLTLTVSTVDIVRIISAGGVPLVTLTDHGKRLEIINKKRSDCLLGLYCESATHA
jgi:hypothetical protein